MKTLFHPLFTVSISHTYYSDGVCKDFDFVIPADTLQWLNNGRLIAKVREGKLYVLFEVGEANEPLVSIAGQRLRFGLKLLNPFFSHFTTLDPNSIIPLYDNVIDPKKLEKRTDKKVVALVGQIFSHSLLSTTKPVTITLKNANGQILQTDTLPVTDKRTTLSYHLLDPTASVYTVTEEPSRSPKITTDYYLDPQLQSQDIFGVIEIKIDDDFYKNFTLPDKFNFTEFNITFDAKQETLNYYVVVNKIDDISKFSISDNGMIFKPVSLTPDDKYALLLGNSDTQVALLQSPVKIARQANARKKIQLKKNSSILIENLPQPAVNQANADMIIYLSK